MRVNTVRANTGRANTGRSNSGRATSLRANSLRANSVHLRWVVPVCVGLAGVLVSACGTAATATTTSVVNMESTNYATIPPTPSTLPPTTTTTIFIPQDLTPGTVTTQVIEYTIRESDISRTKVADYFGITYQQLDAANVETSNYSSFYPGLVIKIPAGATIPEGYGETSTETETTDGGLGSDCIEGEYVLVEGDSPGSVANDFGITTEQLAAANATNPKYAAFVIGTRIIIPKASC